MRSMCRSASTGQTSNGRWMNRNIYPSRTQRMCTSSVPPAPPASSRGALVVPPVVAPLLDRGGVAGGDGPGGDRLHDDAPRADHALVTDVGHDDGAVADPAVAADADRGERAALLLDRRVTAVEVVLMAAAENVHVA